MLFLFELCSYFGVVVLHVLRGCRGDLALELRKAGSAQFWIGLATIAAFCALIWAQVHFHQAIAHSLSRLLQGG